MLVTLSPPNARSKTKCLWSVAVSGRKSSLLCRRREFGKAERDTGALLSKDEGEKHNHEANGDKSDSKKMTGQARRKVILARAVRQGSKTEGAISDAESALLFRY